MVLKEDLGIMHTDVALNGRQAIDKCRQEDFDIVLMDISMPVIGGIEATDEIKRIRPHVKVIMVSMSSDYTTIAKALKAGADAYILKSEGVEDVSKAIRAVLRNEVYLSASLSEKFNQNSPDNNINKDDIIGFSESLITTREKAVLKLIVEGFTNQQIAETLHLSVRTVDTHRTNMLTKLNLPNTASLVRFAIVNKLA